MSNEGDGTPDSHPREPEVKGHACAMGLCTGFGIPETCCAVLWVVSLGWGARLAVQINQRAKTLAGAVVLRFKSEE